MTTNDISETSFGHMTKTTLTSEPLFQNNFIFRRPRVAILLTSSKLQPQLLKQSLRTQLKLKGLEIMY